MSSPSANESEELPQEFRARTISRLQRLINQNLTRLEKEGKTIHVRELPLQTGILLTKHAELSGIAPPNSVHNQTTVIGGIDQASAREILSGRTGKGVAYSSKASPQPVASGDRSPSITPSLTNKVGPSLTPRAQALTQDGIGALLTKPDPFQALKAPTPDPTGL